MSYSHPLDEFKVTLHDIEKMIDLANRGDVSAAEELAHSTVGVNSKGIDDNTLNRISSLLNSPSGAVRMWAAAAIGNFGSRANEYSPRLQEMVSHEACNMTGISAADTASMALQKMGITPIPFGCR